MDDAVRFDELCHSYLMHSGTKGMHWYVNGPGKRYQAHAQYAQGRPNPDTKVRGQKNGEDTSFVKGMTQYPKQTFNDLKKLSGPPDYNTRKEINHPSSENSSDVGRHYNCPNCAAAFDMQERGYDVFARPSKNGLHPADVEAMFKGGDLRGVHNEMTPRVTSKLSKLYNIAESDYGRRGKGAWDQYSSILSRQQQRTADYTIQAIRSQGINNRGVIVVGWLGDPSFKDRTTSYHAFNYKTINGVVTFYDTQSKQKEKINGFSTEQADKGFFTEIDPREVFLMRTSDVEPTERIMSAVYSPDRLIKHSSMAFQEILGKFKTTRIGAEL